MADKKFLREQLDMLIRKKSDQSITWQDVTDFRFEHKGYLENVCTTRKGYLLLKEYLDAGWVKEPETDSQSNSTDLGDLQKEKYKIQTEKIELNRWKREIARNELILEKVVNAVRAIKPLSVPSPLPKQNGNTEYVLCYGDCHLGAEVEIQGLKGEILNKYSPEIFEKRMWELFAKTKKIAEKENIKVLNIYDFGDSIDGLLRISQLWKLRYGVVDSTIKYADFISNWLNEFTKFVKVRFQMVVDSNHSQLRMLGQPKDTFKDENMSKIIIAFIKERLKDNPNFEIIENATGMIFDKVAGYNILGVHGEYKNDIQALKDFSQIYDVKINYLIGAHLHHGKQEEIGQDTEYIRIPSVIGTDDYSLSLRKVSSAGAKLLCFENGVGKTIEYSVKLQ